MLPYIFVAVREVIVPISPLAPRIRALLFAAVPGVIPTTYEGGATTGDPSTVRLEQLIAPKPVIDPSVAGTRARCGRAVSSEIPVR